MKRKAAVEYVIDEHGVTQRRACRVLQVGRAVFRYEAVKRPGEDELRGKVIELAVTLGGWATEW